MNAFLSRLTDAMGRRGISPRKFGDFMVAGWVALVILGQCVIPVEVRPLEWFAAAWLWLAILTVPATFCLPVILLSSAAFMVEIHRHWAWVQVVMVGLFLVRLVLENRFTMRQLLILCLVGTVVFASSWPQDAGVLLLRLRMFPKRELLSQFLAPEATWAIFPFRQSVDRALIATVCAGVLFSGKYLSSHRLWTSLWLVALVPLLEALSADLLGRQGTHLFLGTTNLAKAGFAYGPGVNVSYFAFCLALGLPYFIMAAGRRGAWLRWGTLGLLFPLVRIQQRAFSLAVAALLVVGVCFLVRACLARMRNRALRPARKSRSIRPIVLGCVCFVLCSTVSAAWFLHAGILDSGSVIRRVVAAAWKTPLSLRESARSVMRRPRFVEGKHSNDGIRNGGAPTNAIHAVAPVPDAKAETTWTARIRRKLIENDRARGDMWTLGARTICDRYVWHGAGAGTWARFHQKQPRISRRSFAHMHNTYLDMMFEYGLVPMLLFFGACALAFLRIAFCSAGASRRWTFYLVALAVMALGQHLLYAFTSMCLLLPALIVLARALRGPYGGTTGNKCVRC